MARKQNSSQAGRNMGVPGRAVTVSSARSSSSGLIASLSRTSLSDGLSVSPSSIYWALQDEKPPAPQTEIMSFQHLPYDLLFNISYYLQYNDVLALQLTCKSLYYSFTTRPIYRKLALDLLRRCRPLPLKGFQKLGDLTTPQLMACVHRAANYERAWLVRAPRPITSHSNNYLDVGDDDRSASSLSSPVNTGTNYTLCATKSGKVVCWDVQTDTCLAEWNPGEKWELWKCRVEFEDKMVYFTMAKVLQGTNSYDDTRIMLFTLIKISFTGSETPSGTRVPSSIPTFNPIASFKTVGVVMNIFLLDPRERLLSAFVWVSGSNTIGLYVLLDWEKEEYVFVDTGVECVMSSNWSCILFEDNIVIHCEDSNAAFQHFYPIPMLRRYAKRFERSVSSSRTGGTGSSLGEGGGLEPVNERTPVLSGRVVPFESIVKKFEFPAPFLADRYYDDGPSSPSSTASGTVSARVDSGSGRTLDSSLSPLSLLSTSSSGTRNRNTRTRTATPTNTYSNPNTNTNVYPNPNPFPFPPWYPESAHFVRQWWPTLPTNNTSFSSSSSPSSSSSSHHDDAYSTSGGATFPSASSASSASPRTSCTVVLLAAHDTRTHRTRFVLAQHYFRVPMALPWVDPMSGGSGSGGVNVSMPGMSSGMGGGGGIGRRTARTAGWVGLGERRRSLHSNHNNPNTGSNTGAGRGMVYDIGDMTSMSTIISPSSPATAGNGTSVSGVTAATAGSASGITSGGTTPTPMSMSMSTSNLGSATGAATTLTSLSSSGQPNGPLDMFFIDGPPEGSIVARFCVPPEAEVETGPVPVPVTEVVGAAKEAERGRGNVNRTGDGPSSSSPSNPISGFRGNVSGSASSSSYSTSSAANPGSEGVGAGVVGDSVSAKGKGKQKDVSTSTSTSVVAGEGGDGDGECEDKEEDDLGKGREDLDGKTNMNSSSTAATSSSTTTSASSSSSSSSASTPTPTQYFHTPRHSPPPPIDQDPMRLWYVSEPFEVVCLEDPPPAAGGEGGEGEGVVQDEDEDGLQERPRPLLAVDFGHAVWIEYYDGNTEGARGKGRGRRGDTLTSTSMSRPRSRFDEDGQESAVDHGDGGGGGESEEAEEEAEAEVDETEAEEDEGDGDDEEDDEDSNTAPPFVHPPLAHKRLRFVTFPPFTDEGRVVYTDEGWGSSQVKTLEVPPELDLHGVETINIDQSQGAVILSVEGKIFILCYE
ncbi:hypothetical protein D9757_009700 [Collybiopsis confluens]|uniref:F-box domain-containing protein n=1 Tax=Collybiopsis confluens TaxID=2823264 RepID=A0A8H5M1N9_9AGAR|nr:hypothetical protein D9757_009700 [Collybiopsis confluens]